MRFSRDPFLAIAAFAAAMAVTPAGVSAQGFIERGTDRVYFYEETLHGRTRWGWSASPRPFDPVASARRPRSLAEACGRHVGRTLQTDSASLIVSTRMQDECIRRGGPG